MDPAAAREPSAASTGCRRWCCINPLIYVNEGLRAALTNIRHMHLYIVYPVLIGFCVLFLIVGLRAFRGRVLS